MRNIGKRRNKIKEILIQHIKNNLREYAIITIIFIIGIVFGVIFVNNADNEQINEISSYIKDFVSSIQSEAHVNKTQLLMDTLVSNFLLAFALWFVGSTVVGIPIVYGMIAYRGFCLGYTVSASVATLGTRFRNAFYNYIYIVSKYFVYSMYNSIGC